MLAVVYKFEIPLALRSIRVWYCQHLHVLVTLNMEIRGVPIIVSFGVLVFS
jgi:hypothetical protein